MKKRNIPVILLLPLLSLSCSLSHKMERSISKVGLSQAGKRPAPDTTCYSVPEKITWKDSSGVEHIVTMAERNRAAGAGLLAFVAFAAGLAETGAFPVAEALLAVLGSGIGLNRMKL